MNSVFELHVLQTMIIGDLKKSAADLAIKYFFRISMQMSFQWKWKILNFKGTSQWSTSLK